MIQKTAAQESSGQQNTKTHYLENYEIFVIVKTGQMDMPCNPNSNRQSDGQNNLFFWRILQKLSNCLLFLFSSLKVAMCILKKIEHSITFRVKNLQKNSPKKLSLKISVLMGWSTVSLNLTENFQTALVQISNIRSVFIDTYKMVQKKSIRKAHFVVSKVVKK